MTHSHTKTDNSNNKTHKKISNMTEQQQNCEILCLRGNDSKLSFDSELQISENEVQRSCSPTFTVQKHEGKPNQGFWVFGYGSLVWKVDFPVETSLTGYITGFHRRFYQNSIDHRGTVEKPGRVVTLIPGEITSSRVYGVAYKIADERIDEVVKHLDYREKNGYDRIITRFNPYPQLDEPNHLGAGIDVCIYLATPDNASFAGPTEMPVLAKQICEAVGPSGPNTEYVYNLAEAMRRLFPGVIDEHLIELEKALRLMEMDSS